MDFCPYRAWHGAAFYPRVSLRLPWAKEDIGLSARPSCAVDTHEICGNRVSEICGRHRRPKRHAPKGAEVLSPAASEATPWVKWECSQAPCKGKSVEPQVVIWTFALTGRGMALRFTPGCRFAYPGLRRTLGFQPAHCILAY